jgi:signal transduction histidine kinase
MIDWVFSASALIAVGGMAVAWRAREPTEPDADIDRGPLEPLRASDDVTSAVLESLNAHVAVLDGRGTVVAVGPIGSTFELADSLGVTVAKDRAVNYVEVCRTAAVAGSIEAAAMADGLDAVCGGRSSHAEFEYRSSGRRSDRWLVITVTPRRDAEAGAVVIHRDLTDSKREEDSVRAISARLLSAQEDERRRIARQLHDDVSQRLALLSFELQRLGHVVPSQYGEVAGRATELWERTAEIATAVHDLTYRLHPLKLELLGLNAAISDLRRQLSSRHGIAISFAYEAVPEPLPRDIALCVFRIVQEGLANVTRHSAASHASVEVKGTLNGIVLVIADTGVGFDPEAVGSRGFGLAGMRQRLDLLGGSLRVTSKVGEGTRLEVTVPCVAIDGAAAV